MLRTIFSFVIVLVFAGVALGQIANSAHDFSGQGWGTTEICAPCHTPHNSNTTVTSAPLWNHQVTTATFTTYSSSTMNATVGQPNNNSKLCLSCHDGTVALDNFGGNTTGSHFISGSELIGTNLSNDHPVSFTYNAALATADGDLYNPATKLTSLGGTIEHDLLFGASGSATLECASCHDVHNGYGNPNLLLISNSASAFCLTCHSK
ncbi:MAG: cytochrome c3 family protein [Ignavibacteria bacterium]|nr:cytochrome c3 family protein [Ignavibacteria bacterium]